MSKRAIVLIGLAAFCGSAQAVDSWAPAGARDAPAEQPPARPPSGPKVFLGRDRPGTIKDISTEGILVDLRHGGTQLVQFGEIWRLRRAFASDEPPGSTVIDFANTRLFTASPLDKLVDDLSKRLPMTKLTAPNGEAIYMAANKVTDVSNALPGLHNPASKAVIGTRDGVQQVVEPADEAKKIIAGAQVAP